MPAAIGTGQSAASAVPALDDPRNFFRDMGCKSAPDLQLSIYNKYLAKELLDTAGCTKRFFSAQTLPREKPSHSPFDAVRNAETEEIDLKRSARNEEAQWLKRR